MTHQSSDQHGTGKFGAMSKECSGKQDTASVECSGLDGELQDYEVIYQQTKDRSESSSQIADFQDSSGNESKKLKMDHKSNIMSATIQTWKTEDIYVTECARAVKEKISSKSCVCVVGVPGAGKSTALHYAALSLEREGFNIYYISELTDLFEYYDTDKKQAFVLDDALGVYSVSQNEVKLWQGHNEKVERVLGTHTKLLVSIRTQIFNQEKSRRRKIIFLNKSLTTEQVDFSDTEYKLGVKEMRGMLRHYLQKNKFDVGKVNKQVWGNTYYAGTEMFEIIEFANCWPLLCKTFVNADEVTKESPKQFFKHPFLAMPKVFKNIRSNNPHQFCALILCAIYNGTLNDDYFLPLCEDEDKKKLRDYIIPTFKLKCPDDLEDIQSALKSLMGVYVTQIGNNYKISHTVFLDILTYLYDDPIFVFDYGSSEFIRDRVRINKDEHQRDPYLIKYFDEKNIERLAGRLIRDLRSDHRRGAVFIVSYPNIDNEILVLKLNKLLDKEQVLIDELFSECIFVLGKNYDTYKYGDVPLYKLIELCVKKGVDCNMCTMGCLNPLHTSVTTGSLQLTKLLLDNGADKRRVSFGRSSVLHCVFRAQYNRLELIKLIMEHKHNHDRADNSVVEFITNSKYGIIFNCPNTSNLQLEEVLPDSSVNILANTKQEIIKFAKCNKGKIQLVRHLHDNILTHVNKMGQNILHRAAGDIDVTKYIMGLPNIQEALHRRDFLHRTPYWYVVDKKANDADFEDIKQLYRERNAILLDNKMMKVIVND